MKRNGGGSYLNESCLPVDNFTAKTQTGNRGGMNGNRGGMNGKARGTFGNRRGIDSRQPSDTKSKILHRLLIDL